MTNVIKRFATVLVVACLFVLVHAPQGHEFKSMPSGIDHAQQVFVVRERGEKFFVREGGDDRLPTPIQMAQPLSAHYTLTT